MYTVTMVSEEMNENKTYLGPDTEKVSIFRLNWLTEVRLEGDGEDHRFHNYPKYSSADKQTTTQTGRWPG